MTRLNIRTISTARLSAINDGVFAIAMTLLVLDIKVPVLPDGVTHDVFIGALRQEIPSFLAWLISFAILCRLWMTQHGLLADGKERTRAFAGMNFFFLGAISFIPFPTALMSEHSDQALAVIIFSATYGVASLALGGMWYLLVDRAGDASSRPAYVGPTAKRVIIILPITALLASLLALINPSWGIWVWVLVPFVMHVHRFKGTHFTPTSHEEADSYKP